MSNQKSTPRVRHVAAAMVAAGAIATTGLGPPAPANAQPFGLGFYAAVAYSDSSDIGGVGRGGSEDSARIAALKNCQDKGGNHCVWFGTARYICIALAVRGVKEWATATDANLQTAEQKALAANPGGKIAASGCGLQSPTTNPPPPPGKPRPPRPVPLPPAQQ